MTSHNNGRRRELLHLHYNCIPYYPPIDRTLIVTVALFALEMHWIFKALLISLAVLSWALYFSQSAIGQPVDIFENFRHDEDEEGLNIPPRQS